jgi:hypothetical protein
VGAFSVLACACVDGEIDLTCVPVFGLPLLADCDGEASNGCEQSLTDDAHCGRCDHRCDSGSCNMLQCVED